MTRGFTGSLIARTGRAAFRVAPGLGASILKAANGPAVRADDVRRRLGYAKHVFEWIDLFVAPSRSIAEEFCKLGLPPDRVEVSDYGFASPPRVRGSADADRQARSEPLRIGFVGTLVWHKGVHVLIAAAKRLRGQCEIHIHGDPAVFPDYVAALRKAAIGLPVVFAEGFDRDRVTDVYEALDVLVVPSLWPENSPLVIHEAFMHHVPVVAARTGGVPELVGDGINGLLYEPFNPDSLAMSLQRLIDDRDLLARLSAHCAAVKSIEQDAREWQERYLRLRRPVEVHAWT